MVSLSFVVSKGNHYQAAALLGRECVMMVMIRDGGITRRAAIRRCSNHVTSVKHTNTLLYGEHIKQASFRLVDFSHLYD